MLTLDSCVDLCGNMVKIGETLMTGVQETDSEASQKIATSYDQIMKECADEPLKSAVIASVLFSAA